MTLSFAPDGTDIRGGASGLFGKLGPATDTWSGRSSCAFQSWAGQSNINISVVSDAGVPFGNRLVQSRAMPGTGTSASTPWPLGPDQLAVTAPFDLFGGWGGEVILNTDQAFDVGGKDGAYDLFTVFLEEAGHALSLANSAAAGSAMSGLYTGPVSGPSADDVSCVQALYGTREADQFDSPVGGGTVLATPRLTFVNDLRPGCPVWTEPWGPAGWPSRPGT